MNYFVRSGQCAAVLLTLLMLMNLPGCCSRKTVSRPDPGRKTPVTSAAGSTTTDRRPVPIVENTVVSGNEALRPLRDQDKKTRELYRRFEYAFDMFNSDNLDGALREVERLQLEINNDPYLEMQSWYLSAMIYHKTDKTSRRKRAMRKMLESMEQLQKDPRFRNAFEDGMISQEVIKMAIEKGEGRYAE